MRHSAETGLHDIKALPSFHPVNWNLWIASAFVLLSVCCLSYFFNRKKRTSLAPVRTLTPQELAQARLLELKKSRLEERISLRDFCSELSITLRYFLEQSFSFPAAEQTVQEVASSLPHQLKQYLPVCSKEKRADFVQSVRSNLKQLERYAFSDDAVNRIALLGKEVEQALMQTESLIDELSLVLKRERERTLSITEEISVPSLAREKP